MDDSFASDHSSPIFSSNIALQFSTETKDKQKGKTKKLLKKIWEEEKVVLN